jgi:UDP-glucose 4-epimerase
MAAYIVTGASGYIGSVLCKRLKELGHKVVALDLDPPKHKYYDTYTTANYNDEKKLAVHVKHCDGIFHLAASSLLNPSLEDPLSYYENNVASFYKFLRIIHHYKPNTPVVFASSAAVYGESSETCYAAWSPCNPINPYGFTKLQAEQALNDITKYTGAVPHISFRFFNVAGGYGDVGHSIHRPALLTSLSRAVVNNKDFNQFGNNIRDYIHVLDVCSGLIQGMESITENTSASLNLCSGVLTPTGDAVDLFKKYTGTEFNVIKTDNRAGDPEILKGDNHYTQSYLQGWKPINSNWKNIIESHWEFVKYDRQLSTLD